MVSQFIPGDKLTVKHDIYSAYDVTALLKKFPTRRGEDIEFEVYLRKTEKWTNLFNVRCSIVQVQIAATESEPQTNEDCRMVTHNEISLTGAVL